MSETLRAVAAAAAISFLVIVLGTAIATADPPPVGFHGKLLRPDGVNPELIGCDSLDQVRDLYQAGKNNAFLIHPRYLELAKQLNNLGEPVCLVQRWRPGTVVGRELLGPLANSFGSAKLVVWAVEIAGPGGWQAWLFVVDAAAPPPDGPKGPMVEPMRGPAPFNYMLRIRAPPTF